MVDPSHTTKLHFKHGIAQRSNVLVSVRSSWEIRACTPARTNSRRRARLPWRPADQLGKAGGGLIPGWIRAGLDVK